MSKMHRARQTRRTQRVTTKRQPNKAHVTSAVIGWASKCQALTIDNHQHPYPPPGGGLPGMRVVNGLLRHEPSEIQKLMSRPVHIISCILSACKFMARILNSLRRLPAAGTTPVVEDLIKNVRWFQYYAKKRIGVNLLPLPVKLH